MAKAKTKGESYGKMSKAEKAHEKRESKKTELKEHRTGKEPKGK